MTGNVLDAAKEFAAQGFNPLPTRRGKKSPGLPSWQEYQKKRTDDKIAAWWGPGSSYTGIWIACGAVSGGLIVLDCDTPEGDEEWHKLIGDEMEATTCVRTNKGRHYWFQASSAIPPSGTPRTLIKSWSYDDPKTGKRWFDLKAEGGGVMAPPSEHPDGGYYRWIRGLECLQEAPPAVCDGGVLWAARATNPGAGRSDGGHGEQPVAGLGGAPAPSRVAEEPTSLLSALLEKRPKAGGRNTWLTQVCGHYARLIPFHDAYLSMVRTANLALDDPMEETECLKTANSIWKAEKEKLENERLGALGTVAEFREQGLLAGEFTENEGWLAGTGSQIIAPCIVRIEGQGPGGTGKKVQTKEVVKPWADFDIKVQGIIEKPDGEGRDFLVKLTTTLGAGRSIECVLEGSMLGSMQKLQPWLAERQGSIVSPEGDAHKAMGKIERFQRYVQSQPAPRYQSVEALGWDDTAGAFVTHEGLIRAGADAAHPFEDIRPDPRLRNWAPYRYGFGGSQMAAREVLREVLTFHDKTVCAVFGSWWAASFLKAHIEKETALFPFMALKAPSESGKTTGFFSMMIQLSGNTEGHGEYTPAVLRDRVSAHRNGVVWIDDVTNMDATWDIIRQATMGGGRTKKSQDRFNQEFVKMVAPIAISAESMAPLSIEKALADRAIEIKVPSPTKRTSLKPGREGKPQWDDILDLKSQWGHDLSQLAGWYVSMALSEIDKLSLLRELKPASGRHGDKLGIIRTGARILSTMMGEDSDWVIEEVDGWAGVSAEGYIQGDNILTTQILPLAWKSTLYSRSPDGVDTFVYVDKDGILWYNEVNLADWWGSRRGLSERQRQLGSIDSLRAQRRDLGIDGNGVSRRVGKRSDNVVLRFQALSPSQSKLVTDRASVDFEVDEALPLILPEGQG